MTTSIAGLRQRVEDLGFWYHTIDLAPGLTTPGLFDLRQVVDRLPWPDLQGKRCIDVGTYDGFFAFELERRGAAEVVAVDVPAKALYDWPADVRPGMASYSAADRPLWDVPNNRGFQVAAEIIGSNVAWKPVSIYDLDPAELGTFDVVVCSSLLLHLRDPIRALEAVRSVCGGHFLSFEPIDLWLTLTHPKRSTAKFDGKGMNIQWWTPNGAGQVRMLESAGFEVEQVGSPLMVEFNHHERVRRRGLGALSDLLDRAATRSRRPGVAQRAVLCRPAPT
jgi:tRNA (mo5U34)-methyltransferase